MSWIQQAIELRRIQTTSERFQKALSDGKWMEQGHGSRLEEGKREYSGVRDKRETGKMMGTSEPQEAGGHGEFSGNHQLKICV